MTIRISDVDETEWTEKLVKVGFTQAQAAVLIELLDALLDDALDAVDDLDTDLRADMESGNE